MLVDLREVLCAAQRDAELERVLARVEVALALGLDGRNHDREVADNLVEVLVFPLRGGLATAEVDRRNLHIVREVGVVEKAVGLVPAEVVAEERDSVLVQLEPERERGTVGLVGGQSCGPRSSSCSQQSAAAHGRHTAEPCQ